MVLYAMLIVCVLLKEEELNGIMRAYFKLFVGDA